MKETTKRYFSSWALLAVFLPMLLLSSFHVHPEAHVEGDDCEGCVHHLPHAGHISNLTVCSFDCVLCQFLTLSMLTAAVVAVTVYFHVYQQHHAQPSCGYHATSCGIIVTRGPPSV